MSLNSIVRRGFNSSSLDAIVRRGYAAYTALPQPPAVGYQYETYAGSGAGLWLGAGSSPAVQVGDVFITQLVTSPNSFAEITNPDGTIDVVAGGNTSRQELLFAIYRLAGNAIDPPSFPSSTAIVWINEVAPNWAGTLQLIGIAVGAPVLANFAGFPFASSVEGDVLTFAVATGSLPPGLALASSGVLSGIPTLVGNYAFTISATDITGTSTISAVNQINVSTPSGVPAGNVPNFIGLEYFQALALIQASGFLSSLPVEVVIAQSNTAPKGYVIGQSPPALGNAVAGSSITLTVNKPHGQFPAVEQNEPIPYWYFFQS